MRVFFDCEFSGLRNDTTLISIGLVSSDGMQFYAELTDYNESHLNGWLTKNVLANLWCYAPEVAIPPHVDYVHDNTLEVAKRLTAWFRRAAPFEKIEMWGDVLAWDWVLFCNLFGGPLDLPNEVFYIPFDLATLFAANFIDPDINRETFAGVVLGGQQRKHNALWDAQMIRACYDKVLAHNYDRERRSL